MILSFDMEEANVILSALSDMDDFFLPMSIPRKDLYILANKLFHAMGLHVKQNGEIPIPNLFLDKFDASKSVEIYFTQVEIDYMLCALHAMGFEGMGYPENINLATSRIYNKLNAQFINRVTDRPEDDVWK